MRNVIPCSTACCTPARLSAQGVAGRLLTRFALVHAWAGGQAGEMAKLTEGVRGVMERTHLKGTTGRIVRESSRFDPMEQTADTCASRPGRSQGSLPCRPVRGQHDGCPPSPCPRATA